MADGINAFFHLLEAFIKAPLLTTGIIVNLGFAFAVWRYRQIGLPKQTEQWEQIGILTSFALEAAFLIAMIIWYYS